MRIVNIPRGSDSPLISAISSMVIWRFVTNYVQSAEKSEKHIYRSMKKKEVLMSSLSSGAKPRVVYNQKKHEECTSPFDRYYYYRLKEKKLEEFTSSSPSS